MSLINMYRHVLYNIRSVTCRHSSYQTSQPVENLKQLPKYEATKDPEDWKHVERLLPSKIIPIPKDKAQYASGWKPQTNESTVNQYFVPRNKNFMIPVYLLTSHRGMKKITKIRRVQGDIFQLEKEVKAHVEQKTGRSVAALANELVGYIHIKGDHVNLVKDYLTQKGF